MVTHAGDDKARLGEHHAAEGVKIATVQEVGSAKAPIASTVEVEIIRGPVSGLRVEQVLHQRRRRTKHRSEQRRRARARSDAELVALGLKRGT